MIKELKMSKGQFKGMRTHYSSNAMFIAVLSNPNVKYDHEKIGATIFPNGFSSMDPVGPTAGFGDIVLDGKEASGKISINKLKNQKNESGKQISAKAIKDSLKQYFDGFFVVDKNEKCIKQVSFAEFYKLFVAEEEY